MIKLKFKSDKNFLARYLISTSEMPKDFANSIWDKYRESYIELKQNIFSQNIDKKILQELQNQVFFKDLLKKSQVNCKKMENIWIDNYQIIKEFLSTILKKEIDLKLTANIVAPEICQGRNVGNNNFVWGHKIGETDPNYNLVYIVHESLHSYFELDDINHSIIENIADIELAKHLNKTEKGYSTHKFTQDAHIQVFPYWNLYLNRTKEEIEQEQKTLNIFYDINEYEPFREEFKNLNIDDFVIRCKELVNENGVTI